MKTFLLLILTLLSLKSYSQCPNEFIKTINGRVELRWYTSTKPTNIDSININGVWFKGKDTTTYGIQSFITNDPINTTTYTTIIIKTDTCEYTHNQLPVLFTCINLKQVGNLVQIQWETAWEQNNFGFIIQSKYENNDWDDIKFIGGKGNKLTPTQYESYCRLEKSGNYYCRLLQIDYNGDYEYSDIVTLKMVSPLDLKQYIYFPAFDGVWMRKELK